MKEIGKVFMYGGVVALLLGYLGIIFCGFMDGFLRGVRNFIFPFLGFGDALRKYPLLIWLWLGGIAAIVIGCILI